MKEVSLIIDASNIRAGGGLTHLKEILSSQAFLNSKFTRVLVWASQATLDSLKDFDKLEKKHHAYLEQGYLKISIWQYFILPREVKSTKSLLFIPGTGFSRMPYITMFRNLLPLESRETRRYFFSKTWLRLLLLRELHKYSFKNASGIICLNDYCRNHLKGHVNVNSSDLKVILHGLSDKFKKNIGLNKRKTGDVFRLLYVSIVDVYKHQWEIVRAVKDLVEKGKRIELILVGPSYPRALKKLNEELNRKPELNRAIRYIGKIPYEDLVDVYSSADAFIFASTCETYGMVVTEAMGMGLPILCSRYSSMRSNFGSSAIYFNPLDQESIKSNITLLEESNELREELSAKALEFAEKRTWENCAGATFDYLFDKYQEICVE